MFIIYLDEKMEEDLNVIKQGDVVMIKGLKENPEFNTLFGKVISYDDKESRYNVEILNGKISSNDKALQSQRHLIAVRETNLQRIIKSMLLTTLFVFISFIVRICDFFFVDIVTN